MIHDSCIFLFFDDQNAFFTICPFVKTNLIVTAERISLCVILLELHFVFVFFLCPLLLNFSCYSKMEWHDLCVCEYTRFLLCYFPLNQYKYGKERPSHMQHWFFRLPHGLGVQTSLPL